MFFLVFYDGSVVGVMFLASKLIFSQVLEQHSLIKVKFVCNWKSDCHVSLFKVGILCCSSECLSYAG